MDRVYVTKQLPDDLLEPLGVFDLRVWPGDGPVPEDILRAELTKARGVLTMLTDPIGPDLLDSSPHLEVVSQMAVGLDNVDVAACHRRGIKVGHTPDVLTETVADHAFALLGSVVRRLPEGEREVRAGRWGPWEPFHLTGGDLHGTTLGIVGMGRIGSAVARRATGYDMEVVYDSPRPVDLPMERLELPDLLRRADHVVLTVPLDHDTRGLIGKAELALMKATGYLVNVSRGPIVDTNALVEALRAGEIAGAALDVTDPEPLPPDHPLLDLDNCLVVPHLGSASVATRRAMARLAVDNLVAGLTGRPMPAPVGEVE